MRITNSMMTNTMMRNIFNNLNSMAKLDQQMATGKRINMPSDDPIGISQVLKLSSDISHHEQYKKNVDQALSWMQATETSVMQLKDVMQKVRELTARGATGTLTDEDKAAIQKDITQLKDQIVSIGNTNFAGKYIFAGYNTMEKPFAVEGTTIGNKLKYNGRILSPGGAIDDDIEDTDFQEFLTNKNNKAPTYDQMADKMNIEIGTGDMLNANLNGTEILQKGFYGTFETLTKLEKSLGGEKDYKQGFVDMEYGTRAISYTELDNSNDDKSINIKIGNDSFDLKLPYEELTEESIQNAIDSVEHLKKNGVKVHLDEKNKTISFTAQAEITPKVSLGISTISTNTITYKDGDLDNSSKDRKLKIKIDGEENSHELSLPASNPLTQKDIQDEIDKIPALKTKNVTVKIDDTNKTITFSADNENITVEGTLGNTEIMTTSGKANQQIAPILVGERMKGTIETDDTNHQFNLTIDGIEETINLPQNKKYELDTQFGKDELLKDIQDQIDGKPSFLGKVKVSFTEDHRLKFTGNYQDASNTDFESIKISNLDDNKFLTKIGFANDQVSQKASIKTEKIDISGMLKDMDQNLNNVLAKLSEIGAKTNRLELDKNRLDDNILNFTALLSKTQDADMMETVMKFKTAENIYRASLSTGAKIIQPTLMDFLR
ncbi:flagellar hook-associated protein FlgL [Crassaminicella profunda]|uniref:flagellar hook-associated protein FlgL n=1 Tax=Crassaminicella profunda TaxID=1286698 RepID=UPI001CA6D2A5|nr:flagellar hook-associated protein FlgL [Crassaminicella profunda]QZY54319.1 flagellar hook-associated protein FlgL [Crassaminicella profunda]